MRYEVDPGRYITVKSLSSVYSDGIRLSYEVRLQNDQNAPWVPGLLAYVETNSQELDVIWRCQQLDAVPGSFSMLVRSEIHGGLDIGVSVPYRPTLFGFMNTSSATSMTSTKEGLDDTCGRAILVSADLRPAFEEIEPFPATVVWPIPLTNPEVESAPGQTAPY